MEKRNFRLKMHFACAKDDLRPVMQHVYFENGFMIATDAHVLVKAAVQHFSDFDQSEVDVLNGRLLHKNTFKKIMNCEMVVITENGIQDLATKDVYAFAQIEDKFPNYESIIPKNNEAIDHIGLQPKVVEQLMKVLNSTQITGVKWNFTAINKAIRIEGMGDNEGTLTAILMPTFIEG